MPAREHLPLRAVEDVVLLDPRPWAGDASGSAASLAVAPRALEWRAEARTAAAGRSGCARWPPGPSRRRWPANRPDGAWASGRRLTVGEAAGDGRRRCRSPSETRPGSFSVPRRTDRGARLRWQTWLACTGLGRSLPALYRSAHLRPPSTSPRECCARPCLWLPQFRSSRCLPALSRRHLDLRCRPTHTLVRL